MPTDQQILSEEQIRFRNHLDEASAFVATWEPWEHHIFGGSKCGVADCPLCQPTAAIENLDHQGD